MTSIQYILNGALPFCLNAVTPEADRLFKAVPPMLMKAMANAETHEDEVRAGDAVETWIAANWMTVLPEVAARFNPPQPPMKFSLEQTVDKVKAAAARKSFWEGVKVYGSKWHALRAYDSQTVEEAVEMLKESIKIRIYKSNGNVVVEAI